MHIFDNPIVLCIGDGSDLLLFLHKSRVQSTYSVYTRTREYRVRGSGPVLTHAQYCVVWCFLFIHIFVLVLQEM